MAAGKTNKVFGIGLDGATYDLLLPWFKEGKLPTLKKIYENGANGVLRSSIPYMSPTAWTSFMTGQNPGKHGIYDFTQFKENSYEIFFSNASTRRSKSLWKILSDHGKKVIVINVPMTYPPEKVNGILISGMEAPGVQSVFTYPHSIYKELVKEIGEYNLHGDYYTRFGPEVYLERAYETINNQSEAARYLLKNKEWDFFFFVFGTTDRIQHFFWKYIDPEHPNYTVEEAEKYGDYIYRIYKLVDEKTKELLELVPDDSLNFIMSDHGAGSYHTIVHIDKWLHNENYLAFENKKNPFLKDLVKSSYVKMRKYFPRQVKDLLKSRIPSLRRAIESKLLMDDIDWSKSKVFSTGVEATHLYINTKERFPMGIVNAGNDYDVLVKELMDKLYQLKDPRTGEKVIERIYKREELYDGGYSHNTPDLFIRWKDDKYITRKSYEKDFSNPDNIFDANLKHGEIGELMSLEQSGTHKEDGIIMVSGKNINNISIENAHIMDIAPTLLAGLGLPIPEDMDGKVLDGLFHESFLKENPIGYSSESTSVEKADSEVYSKEDEEAIKERLKQLGYLDE